MAAFRKLLGNCLTEARPIVIVIFLLRFAAGSVLAAHMGERAHPLRAVAAGAVWGAAVFAVYLFNGVTDVAEDRVNGSRRPIASGALDPRGAAIVAGVAAGGASLGGVLLGGATTWCVAVLLALGYAYSGRPFRLKRRSLGTAAVGCTAGLLSYVSGFTAYGGGGWGGSDAAAPIVFALAASLWMGAVGTPTKDLPDIAGDGAAGRRTFAVRHGDRATRLVAAAVALTLSAAFCAVTAALRLPLLGPGVAMLAGATALALVALTRCSLGTGPRGRRPYQVFMATQYAVHLSVVLPLAL